VPWLPCCLICCPAALSRCLLPDLLPCRTSQSCSMPGRASAQSHRVHSFRFAADIVWDRCHVYCTVLLQSGGTVCPRMWPASTCGTCARWVLQWYCRWYCRLRCQAHGIRLSLQPTTHPLVFSHAQAGAGLPAPPAARGSRRPEARECADGGLRPCGVVRLWVQVGGARQLPA
jgi:hypothetical protein